MSVTDYRCVNCDCDADAVAVRQTSNPTAFYGACAKHLRPLGQGETWLWPPTPSDPAPYIELSDDADAPYMLHLGAIGGDFYVAADEAAAFAHWLDGVKGGTNEVTEAIYAATGTECEPLPTPRSVVLRRPADDSERLTALISQSRQLFEVGATLVQAYLCDREHWDNVLPIVVVSRIETLLGGLR